MSSLISQGVASVQSLFSKVPEGTLVPALLASCLVVFWLIGQSFTGVPPDFFLSAEDDPVRVNGKKATCVRAYTALFMFSVGLFGLYVYTLRTRPATRLTTTPTRLTRLTSTTSP